MWLIRFIDAAALLKAADVGAQAELLADAIVEGFEQIKATHPPS